LSSTLARRWIRCAICLVGGVRRRAQQSIRAALNHDGLRRERGGAARDTCTEVAGGGQGLRRKREPLPAGVGEAHAIPGATCGIYHVGGIARRNDDGAPMVHGLVQGEQRGLLTTMWVARAGEGSDRLVRQFALQPQASRGVEKMLELGGHAAKASRSAKHI